VAAPRAVVPDLRRAAGARSRTRRWGWFADTGAGEAPADSDYTEVQKNFSTSVNALGKSLGDILGTVLSSS